MWSVGCFLRNLCEPKPEPRCGHARALRWVLITEVPEFCGAEHILAHRAKDAETGRVHLGTEGVPDRVRWAGQLIVARAALDKPMFDALIMSLPEDKAVVGSYVGAVLETVAVTMNGLPDAASETDGE